MTSKTAKEVEGRRGRPVSVVQSSAKATARSGGKVVRWYGVVLDVEDRTQAENALKETKAALAASEQNLRLIIDLLPVLVWSARPDGSGDFVNRSRLDYAGLSAERLLDWGFLALYHPDYIADG